MTITNITFPKAANGGPGQNGANGSDAIFTQNGKIGADSLTVNATGQEGGDGGLPNGSGGKGGNASITFNGNIFNAPAGNDVLVSLNATGGLGGLGVGTGVQGNGGNATVVASGNIISPNKVMNNIFLDAIAKGGVGPTRGNAIATVNGNIIQPSKGAVNVRLNASATVPNDDSSHDGSALWGTKTATLNGNIVQGNISGTVTLLADTWDYNTPNLGASNGTANINGNIVQLTATSTAPLTVEASGNHISITNNKFTVGLGALNLTVNEFTPFSDVTIKDNTFKGTGNNTFVFTDNVVQGSHTDTVVINLGANTFTFNSQNNTLTGFNSASMLGNGDPATLIGNDNNNTLTGGVGIESFTGGKGNDTIDGGAGIDTAVYSGNYAQYTVALPNNFSTGTVTDNTVGRDGTDTVSGIEFLQFADGTYNVATMVFTPTVPMDIAPVVTTTPGTTAAQEQIAIAVDGGVTVTDSDNLTLVGATVSITGGFQTGEDQLNFVNQNGISGIYNSLTGVLTLSGSASVANYQTALESVTYTDTSDTPNTGNRTVSFQANDGTLNSNLGTKTVSVAAVNDAPVVTTSVGTTAAQEQVAIVVDGSVTVTDVDSPNLTGATVSITGGFQTGEDQLNFVNQNGISGIYNSLTGVLTLSGSSSLANYQTALESVTYTDTSNTPNTGNRTISFQVNDGFANSNAGTKTVSVAEVNDAPVATITPLSYSINEQSTYSFKNNGLSISDVDAGAGNVTATLAVGEGTLTVTAGGTTVLVGGSGTSTVTLTGTVAQINALLNSDGTSTVDYFDNVNTPTHNTSLSLTVNDNGNTGTGGPLSGNDTASLTINGGEEYFGTPGPDTHTGTAFDDIMHVSAGTDTLDGGAHITGDTLEFDTVTVSGVTYTINQVGAVSYTTAAGAGQTTATNFENLVGSGFDDVLTGDSGQNVIDGGAGDDILVATAGGDTLTGGANGAGGDTADFSAGGAGITVDLNLQGGPQAITNFGNVTLNGIENITGTAFDDTLAGDANNNVLDGAGGNNTVVYSGGTTDGLVVSLMTGSSSGGGNGDDTLANIQNVTGSDFNDTLIGDDGDNALTGGDGNDILYGHGGINTLSGGNGTDVAYYYGMESDPSYFVTGSANSFAVLGGPDGVVDAGIAVERLKFLAPSHVADADNNGYSDLFFQDASTGDIELHVLSSGDPDGSAGPNPISITGLGSNWKLIGTGQFTPDDPTIARQAGVLLQDITGDLKVITDLTNPVPVASPNLNVTVNGGLTPQWKAVAIGDFNGDAASDILLQNISGSVEIITLNTDSSDAVGTVNNAASGTVASPGAAWKVISAGDFNGDGKSDILWQNATTKAVEVTLMDGINVTNTPPVLAAPGLTAIGSGDFNGDGFSDVLFKNAAGNAVVWFMYGDTRTGTKTIANPGGTFTLKGAEDVDGNGFSDLLWQDGSNNTTATLLGGPSSLVNTTVLTPSFPMSPPTGGFSLVASNGGG